MTSGEARDIVRAAMTELGLDVSDAAAVVEAQRDFAHLRRHRKATERIAGQIVRLVIGIVIAGGLGMIWLGFKGSLGK